MTALIRSRLAKGFGLPLRGDGLPLFAFDILAQCSGESFLPFFAADMLAQCFADFCLPLVEADIFCLVSMDGLPVDPPVSQL